MYKQVSSWRVFKLQTRARGFVLLNVLELERCCSLCDRSAEQTLRCQCVVEPFMGASWSRPRCRSHGRQRHQRPSSLSERRQRVCTTSTPTRTREPAKITTANEAVTTEDQDAWAIVHISGDETLVSAFESTSAPRRSESFESGVAIGCNAPPDGEQIISRTLTASATGAAPMTIHEQVEDSIAPGGSTTSDGQSPTTVSPDCDAPPATPVTPWNVGHWSDTPSIKDMDRTSSIKGSDLSRPLLQASA
ncbi:hypothetical protein C2E23DRAFT_621920 [Lenzites betulinus]|nr:hypothetical protein C2E23DRAFT_621920 [Lenzites betulinus]